jgi:hypothetical protein
VGEIYYPHRNKLNEGRWKICEIRYGASPKIIVAGSAVTAVAIGLIAAR